MGLDHGLTRKHYVGNYDGIPDEKRIIVTVQKPKDLPHKFPNATYIIEDAITWRKVNAIHRWFVENIQDDEDDCKTYDIPPQKIEELLGRIDMVLGSTNLVKGKVHNGTSYANGKTIEHWEDGKVLKDSKIAHKLLPIQEGFFFGGKEYDEYYWEELVRTRDVLTQALADEPHAWFEYWSSW